MTFKSGKYMMAMFVMATAACASVPDSPDSGIPSADKCAAGLYVTFYGGEADGSRATPAPGDYETGSAGENYIDIYGKDFRVFIFDIDDKYVASLENITVTPEAASPNMKRYRIDGEIDNTGFIRNKDAFKVMVLANWRGEYPVPVAGVTDIADIAASEASVYSYDADASDMMPIPMFGISDRLEGLEFISGMKTNLGTLHMLRAYAKVRVRAAASGLPLTAVSLTKACSRGFRAPLGVRCQADYVHGNYAGDYTATPSVPPSAATLHDIAFSGPSAAGEWTLYVPEYLNIAEGDPLKPLDSGTMIKAVFKSPDGKQIEEYVEFKYYSTPPSYSGASAGDHFDILRNTVYDYTLNKTVNDGDIEIEVDIQPFAELWLTPDFGLMRDEDGDLAIIPEIDDKGQVILPDNLKAFLDTYGKTLPAFSLAEGDYYAVHLYADGQLANADIWLKDSEGCHVISDFSYPAGHTPNCGSREVVYVFNGSETVYRKDRHGDRVLQHNSDHSSVVYDGLGRMIFKNEPNTLRYQVESWDEDSGLFWIISTDAAGKQFFLEYDNSGHRTSTPPLEVRT